MNARQIVLIVDSKVGCGCDPKHPQSRREAMGEKRTLPRPSSSRPPGMNNIAHFPSERGECVLRRQESRSAARRLARSLEEIPVTGPPDPPARVFRQPLSLGRRTPPQRLLAPACDGYSLCRTRTCAMLTVGFLMLIFSRRTLQQVIDQVAGHVPDGRLRSLITKVDRANKNGIPDVWELYLFAGHLLAHSAKYETPLTNGKRPDIFLPTQSIYVDVKTISDDHAHAQYPIEFFMDTLKAQVVRRLPVMGDFHVDFGSRKTAIDGQFVWVPVLPPKREIDKITKAIALELLRRGGDFSSPFEHLIAFDDVPTKISYTPARWKDMPLIGWGSPHFTTHRKHDREVASVAKRALDEARQQLASAPEGALTGVYLCDGGTDLWTKGSPYRTFPIHDIARRYLRESSRLDFVVLFSVEKNQDPDDRLPHSLRTRSVTYRVSHSVVARNDAVRDRVEVLVREALARLDPPLQNIESAYSNRKRTAQSIGFRGGWSTMGDTFRIPARSLGEILAGGNASAILDGDDPRPPRISEILARCHREGKTIIKIEFVSGRPSDDDWVDITFGPRDAAAGPLELPKSAASPRKTEE